MPWVLLVINILCIVLCCQIAQIRHSDIRFWGIMGLLFGPFAVPFVFFSAPKTQKKNQI